jgi:hypothetical protein
LLIQGISLGLYQWIFESPMGSFLFLNIDLPEKYAYGADDLVGVSLIVASILSLFWKNLVIFLYIFLCFFMFALFQTIIGGLPHTNLTLFAHAARYLTPIGLYFLLRNSKSGITILKVGVSLTFIAHGIECLYKDPLFVDYLIYALKWFSLNEDGANNLLLIIGTADILVGIISLIWVNPWVYFYMAFWGLFTAFYRVLYEGGPGYLSMLMRSSHYFVPLFLGFYVLKFRKKKVSL